jgi:hypothetical protein
VKRIVLKNDEAISVNDEWVRLDTERGLLTGKDTAGEFIEIDIEKIMTVQSPYSSIVVFNRNGGRVSSLNKTITGMKPDSTIVSVPFSDVCYVTGRTSVSEIPVGGIVALGAVCAILMLAMASAADLSR